MKFLRHTDWLAWGITLSLIVIFREGSVWVMTQLDFAVLGNLVGLISFLLCLVIWRRFKRIPPRLIDTNSTLMRESSFAFLPTCAGSLMILLHMGKEMSALVLIMAVSTLIPLWIYAKMAKKWL